MEHALQPYTVALVLDPNFGDRLYDLSARVHTWVIGSPANSIIAKRIWDTRPDPTTYSIESGVTLMDMHFIEENPQGFESTLESLDLHHGVYSHQPGYTVLEVYGASFDEKQRQYFTALGFTTFEPTDYGFRVLKDHP